MKLTAGRIESFVNRPDPAIVAVLVYGPDQGLVGERSDRLVAVVSGDPKDPFRVAELSPAALKDDPARLADEAAALPFSGGRRVVRVRDAIDGMTTSVRTLLESGGGGGFVVMEAGELGPRSSLRQLFEGDARAAAIPCYVEEGDALRRFVQSELVSAGFTIASDAMEALLPCLGADRGVTRRELEKLMLYVGSSGPISADDVIAVAGGAGAVSLDTVVYAACGGDVAALDRSLTQAFTEGVQPIVLLRSTSRHLRRLLQVRSAMTGAATAKQAIDALKPPVFFRLQPEFRRQVQVWDDRRLAEGLVVLDDAERTCKRTRYPQRLLCHRALMRLAELVRTGNTRRNAHV